VQKPEALDGLAEMAQCHESQKKRAAVPRSDSDASPRRLSSTPVEMLCITQASDYTHRDSHEFL
jgi:putative aminopeptidase FrvX